MLELNTIEDSISKANALITSNKRRKRDLFEELVVKYCDDRKLVKEKIKKYAQHRDKNSDGNGKLVILMNLCWK